MKKFKIYIFMLLVPLLLVGCVEKGKSIVNVDVGLDNLGGYTWEQLQTQVSHSSYGVLANKSWIDYVSEKTTDIEDKQDVDNLSNYLQRNVYNKIIVEDTSFDYSVASVEVGNLEKLALKSIDIYNEDQLTIIKDALKEFVKTTVTVTGSTIISNIENTKENILTRESYNTFYSPLYDLYTQSFGSYGLKKISIITYFDSIGFDINGTLSNNMNITSAYNSLILEIATIEASQNKTYTDYLSSTLLQRMNELKVQYEKMINGTGKYDSITSARILLRLADTIDLTKVMVIYWNDVIDDIYSKLQGLSNLDPADSKIVIALINHINAYYELNKQYDKTNYALIHSKTSNILKEFLYLKNNYQIYLNEQLGLKVF